MRLQISAKKRVGYKIASLIAIFAVVAQPMYGLVASQAANAISGTADTLQAAINGAQAGDTITLTGNVTTGKQITISKDLILDGGGYIISAAFSKTNNDNNSIIGIGGGANVTLSNLTLEGAGGTGLHGVNVYASSAAINDVKIFNNNNTAININGSTVTVSNLETAGHRANLSFGIIGLAKGSGITQNPSLVIGGRSIHAETGDHHIRRLAGTVLDSNSQYDGPIWGYRYKLKPAPAAPIISAPAEGQAVTTADGSVAISWGGVSGAHSYLVSVDGGVSESVSGTSVTKVLAAGTHTVTVQSVAQSGLLGGTSTVRNFTIIIPDTEAPIVEVSSGGITVEGMLYNPGIFTIKATDQGNPPSGLDVISYSVWKYDPSKGNGPYGTGHHQVASRSNKSDDTVTYDTDSLENGLTDGKYFIGYSAIDKIGNSAGGRVEFTIDRTKPNSVKIAIDRAINPTEVKILAKDTHLNRIDVSLWREGQEGSVAFPGEWISPVGADFSKDYADRLNLAGLEEGRYEVRATATDAAGNATNAESVYFTVNNTAPRAVVTVGSLQSGDFTKDKNITITGKGAPAEFGTDIKTHFFELRTPGKATHIIYNDKTSKRCTLNGANECSFDLASYYDGDGEYSVRFVATDKQGIRSDGFEQPWVKGAGQATFAFTVDTTPPAIAINPPSSTSVSGTVDKDAAEVWVKVGGGEWRQAVYISGETTWTLAISPALAVGTHNITARAVDKVGNTNRADTNPAWKTAQVKVLAVAGSESGTGDSGGTTNTDGDRPVVLAGGAAVAVPVLNAPAANDDAVLAEEDNAAKNNKPRITAAFLMPTVSELLPRPTTTSRVVGR